MDGRFVKKLITNLKCGVCGQNYKRANISLLGHKEELWFLSVFCPACGTQGLVFAAINEGKVSDLITDLNEKEYAKFANADAVDIDDVLEVHNLLKEFGGDVSSLFPQR